MYSSKHEQTATPFTSWHRLFGPHGDGRHTSIIVTSVIGSSRWIWHDVNGSPVYPMRQIHVGTWLMVEHSALFPQIPGHGSLHLLRIQALSAGQSLLKICNFKVIFFKNVLSIYESTIENWIRNTYTFWTATFVRIAMIIINTTTRSNTILFTTNSIWSAWRWLTWIDYFFLSRNTERTEIIIEVKFIFSLFSHWITIAQMDFQYMMVHKYTKQYD